MNDRLTLQDLVDLLAKKQEITKKDAETFLRELVALVSETIEQNEPVKIKDFGTFKLTRVNARKSVDVNTGEDIEIAAHYKLSFTPDKSLREAINKPFAHFESVILEEGVSFENIESSTEDNTVEDTEVEAEDIEIVGEEFATPQLEEMPSIKERIAEILKEEDLGQIVTSRTIVKEEEPDTTAPEQTETTTEPEVKEEPTPPSTEQTEQLPVIDKPEVRTDYQNYDYEQKGSILNRIPRWTIFAVVFLAIIIVAGIVFQPQISNYVHDLREDITLSKTQQEAQSSAHLGSYIAPTDSTKQDIDSIAVKTTPSGITPSTAEPSEKTVIKEPVTNKSKTATIESGMTLRMLGLEHYGNKSFWVYIYQENKSKIANPNNVPLGTVLSIPAKEKYGIDPKSPESVKKARQLEEQLFKEL